MPKPNIRGPEKKTIDSKSHGGGEADRKKKRYNERKDMAMIIEGSTRFCPNYVLAEKI